MSAHTDASREIRAIATKAELESLISACAIDGTEREILRMRYIARNDMGYIADMLGLSYACAVRRHKVALVKLAAVAKMMQKS